MMISDPVRPKSEHTPKRDEDSEEIGEQEHGFGLEFEVFLDIPEAKGRGNRASSLSDSKVCKLKE